MAHTDHGAPGSAGGARRVLAVLAALALATGPVLPAAAAADVGPAAGSRAAAPLSDQPTVPPVGGFRSPVDGPFEVTRPFQPPPLRWLSGHRGVDLSAEPGTVVRAAGPGTVGFAGPVAGTGVVTVVHAGGLRTTYQPVEPLVAAGDPVRAGDPIGVLAPGHPGCPVVACLHWGLRHGDLYLDPLTLLGRGPVRLLPRRRRRDATAAGPADPARTVGAVPHRRAAAWLSTTTGAVHTTGTATRGRGGRPARVAP